MKTFRIIRDVILGFFLVIALTVIVCTIMGWSAYPAMVKEAGIPVGALVIKDASFNNIVAIPILGYIVYYCWSLVGKIVLGLITLGLIISFFFTERKRNSGETSTKENMDTNKTPITEEQPIDNIPAQLNGTEDINNFDIYDEAENYLNTSDESINAEEIDTFTPNSDDKSIEESYLEMNTSDDYTTLLSTERVTSEEEPGPSTYVMNDFEESIPGDEIDVNDEIGIPTEDEISEATEEEVQEPTAAPELFTPDEQAEEIEINNEIGIPSEDEIPEVTDVPESFTPDEQTEEKTLKAQFEEDLNAGEEPAEEMIDDDSFNASIAAALEEAFNESVSNENSLIAEDEATPEIADTDNEESVAVDDVDATENEQMGENSPVEADSALYEMPAEEVVADSEDPTTEESNDEESFEETLPTIIDDIISETPEAPIAEDVNEPVETVEIGEEDKLQDMQEELPVEEDHEALNIVDYLAINDSVNEQKIEELTKLLEESNREKEELARKVEENDGLLDTLSKRKEEIKNLQNKLSVVNKENKEFKTKATEDTNKLKELEDKIEAMSKEYESAMEKKAKSFEDSKRSYRNEADKLKKLLSETNGEVDKLTAEISSLKSDLETAKSHEQEHIAAEKSMAEYKARVDELEAMLTEAKDIDSKNKQVYLDTVSELDKSRAEILDINEKFSRSTKQYNSLYERYTQTIEFLVKRGLVKPEILDREKKAYERI